MHTAETLWSLYRELPAGEQRRFDQLHSPALAVQLERYQACHQARRLRTAQRNEAVHRLIRAHRLPTTTREDWRRILAALQAAEPLLTYQKLPRPDHGDAPIVGPRAARPIQARTLRTSYCQWLQTTAATRRAAA